MDKIEETTGFTQAQNDRLIKNKPLGHVKELIGYPDIMGKISFFGLCQDWAFNNCVLLLVKQFDCGMWVRYRRNQIVLY